MKIRYFEAAEAEFEEAIHYYNEQRTGLGFEFSDEVKDAITRIQNCPSALDTDIGTHSPLPGPSISLQHHLPSTSRFDRSRRNPTPQSQASKLA